MIFPKFPLGIIVRRNRPLATLIGGSLILLGMRLASTPARAAPLPEIIVKSNQTVADFPNTLTFQLNVHSSTILRRIVLEYGVGQLTCGDVVAKAFPDFEANIDVEAEWTWDMHRSGSEPPGSKIWWQWRVIDADGNETRIDRQETLWLDSEHAWQSLSGQGVTVHWYRTDAGFGKQMFNAAAKGVARVHDLIDLQPLGAVDIYLYSTFDDLGAAVLYEPGWTGGLSFGGYNIIILGIPSGQEDWGKSAIAHELMHTIVDDYTFSCLVEIPSWLHEGLAMDSEGGPGAAGMADLQSAIGENTIFPVRSLGGNFPEDPSQAQLAYEESFSVVDFLIQKWGSATMRLLLTALRDGKPIDAALDEVYGFNVDGLDAAWRKSVGAQPLPPQELQPTFTPTVVPTFRPLSIKPASTLAESATPRATGSATTTASATAMQPTQSSARVSLGSSETILVLCVCLLCLVLTVAGGAILIWIVAWGKK
jgi:hypothetical protein